MGENSAISWTDHSFNPWWGCLRVGPGCDNCYAADLDKRTGGNYWDGETLPRRTLPANWNKPRIWNRKAQAAGVRAKVFCASMADVFDNRVPPEWRADLWALVKETPFLDWIIVTKRAGNVVDMLRPDWQGFEESDDFPNVWILATVVNQLEADRDIPKLWDAPAYIRGLSVEPQLGPIVLLPEWLRWLSWVIVGAESGPNRRAFHEDWVRMLRDQCAGNVPFFYKQRVLATGRKIETPELDGRQWMEFPRTPKWFTDHHQPTLLDELENMNAVLNAAGETDQH